MADRREAYLRLALVAASVLACAAVAEVALRIAGYTSERYAAVARLHDRDWTALLDCYPSNPRGYFDLDLRSPAVRERYFRIAPQRFDAVAQRSPYAVAFQYNALGFRDRPPEPKRDGVTRVVLIGDSFTEGQGVKEVD